MKCSTGSMVLGRRLAAVSEQPDLQTVSGHSDMRPPHMVHLKDGHPRALDGRTIQYKLCRINIDRKQHEEKKSPKIQGSTVCRHYPAVLLGSIQQHRCPWRHLQLQQIFIIEIVLFHKHNKEIRQAPWKLTFFFSLLPVALLPGS